MAQQLAGLEPFESRTEGPDPGPYVGAGAWETPLVKSVISRTALILAGVILMKHGMPDEAPVCRSWR